jgi:hypothetical protein
VVASPANPAPITTTRWIEVRVAVPTGLGLPVRAWVCCRATNARFASSHFLTWFSRYGAFLPDSLCPPNTPRSAALCLGEFARVRIQPSAACQKRDGGVYPDPKGRLDRRKCCSLKNRLRDTARSRVGLRRCRRPRRLLLERHGCHQSYANTRDRCVCDSEMARVVAGVPGDRHATRTAKPGTTPAAHQAARASSMRSFGRSLFVIAALIQRRSVLPLGSRPAFDPPFVRRSA